MKEPNLSTLLTVIKLETGLGPDSKGDYHILMTPQVLRACVGEDMYRKIRHGHGAQVNENCGPSVDPGGDQHKSEWMETK